MKNFNRFLRSRNGIIALVAVLVLLVVVAVVLSSQTGPTPGTVLNPTYPRPAGNYTCMPTCAEDDGRFLANVSAGAASFGGAKAILWIAVPGDYTQFEVGFFDGDSGRDNSGAKNWNTGNWDGPIGEVTYTLYADPLMDGQGMEVVQTWTSEGMPNNAWSSAMVPVSINAQSPGGHYFFRLEVDTPLTPKGIGRYKVRSDAYLIAGAVPSLDIGLPLIGGLVTYGDLSILHPQYAGDLNNPGPSKYTGQWQFSFYLPNDMTTLEIWDGDFDRGPSAAVAADTDDLNSQGKPAWAGPFTVDERAGGKGNPADDTPYVLSRRSPAVVYEVTDPAGSPIYSNPDPSGTEEWEKYMISTDANNSPDQVVESIQPGFYNMNITGLDSGNAVWVRLANICDAEDGCGPTPWGEGVCPRTIGYWKNNVNKVLIQGKTNGAQETPESLDRALKFVAMASPLYRSGINLANPEPISTAARLTNDEVNTILQRKNPYPGDSQSMLARALQQNMASWLNLASGKIGPTTIVTLNVAGGPFEGTVLEALRYAETVILTGDEANMERAKDIGDQINNGLLGEDAVDSTCSDYTVVMPPDKQPPAHEDMPKSPKKNEQSEVPQEPAPSCTAGNTYNVENTTNSPFYSVKFNFNAGTEVKEGGSDTFKYILPADVVAGMTTMQVEIKAADDARVYELACDFTSPVGCGGEPTGDEAYAVSFDSAVDNGDGTYTLTFTVYVKGQHGLSHVSFSLPEGQTAGGVDGGSYTTEACVAP